MSTCLHVYIVCSARVLIERNRTPSSYPRDPRLVVAQRLNALANVKLPISIILFIFTPATNISAFLFGASFGFLWLSTVPATSGIVAHLFGTKYLGMLYGIVFLSHQIGSFFGAYLGGLFHDLYGSYDYAWYLAIALSVFAAIIHLPIREEPVLRLKTE